MAKDWWTQGPFAINGKGGKAELWQRTLVNLECIPLHLLLDHHQSLGNRQFHNKW